MGVTCWNNNIKKYINVFKIDIKHPINIAHRYCGSDNIKRPNRYLSISFYIAPLDSTTSTITHQQVTIVSGLPSLN